VTMDETTRLRMFLDACHDVLPQLGDEDGEIAEHIRETCRAIERRLEELTAAARSAS
jgi:hypothetical protein